MITSLQDRDAGSTPAHPAFNHRTWGCPLAQAPNLMSKEHVVCTIIDRIYGTNFS